MIIENCPPAADLRLRRIHRRWTPQVEKLRISAASNVAKKNINAAIITTISKEVLNMVDDTGVWEKCWQLLK